MLAVTYQEKLKKNETNIESEISLLIYCAKNIVDREKKQKIAISLQNGIDWKYLILTAKRHKILPLLYANLISFDSDLIAKDKLQQFQNVLQFNTHKNFQLTQELLGILSYLETNEVEAIPVKGIILADIAYDNFNLRSVSDLDIIVRKKDFVKTQQLLIDRGYQAGFKNKESYYQQAQYYKKKNIAIAIDLHYEFAPHNHFAKVDSSLFWQNIKPYNLAIASVLCLEGLKEHWRSLNRLCDLSQLIKNQEIDWKLLLDNAEALNKKKVVYLGLYLAHTVLDTPIPNDILQEINNLFTRKISQDKIHKFLFRQKFNLLIAIEWYLFISQAFPTSTIKTQYLYRVIKEKLESKK